MTAVHERPHEHAPTRRILPEDAGAVLAVLISAVLFRLALSGSYEKYVRVGMFPWLVAAAVLFGLLGVAGIARAMIGHGGADAHGHDHAGAPRVAMLLLLPVVAVFLVAPAGLGSFAAGRAGTAALPHFSGPAKPLVPGPDGSTHLGLADFSERLAQSPALVQNHPVTLTGFVDPDPDDASAFVLTRFLISCCAADAVPVKVEVVGAQGTLPPRDAWVNVRGAATSDTGIMPVLHADSVTVVPQPEDPYDH